MATLMAGLIAMLGVHSIKIVAPQWRDAVVARYGEGPYKGAYSLVAIGGLVLIVWGFARTWDRSGPCTRHRFGGATLP